MFGHLGPPSAKGYQKGMVIFLIIYLTTVSSIPWKEWLHGMKYHPIHISARCRFPLPPFS
jgi:hypothetical protein